MIINILLIIFGFFLLIKGADILVDGSSNIAKKFHIPEIVIGLTIVAIGTSMPELMVSLNASIKGLSDISVGNVIGSNLANLLLILGVTSIIKPLVFKRETKLIESPFTLFITILFFIFANYSIFGDINVISRGEGIVLLLLCILFIIYNLIMAKKGNEFDREKVKINKKEENKINIWKSLIMIIIGIIGLKFGGDFVVENVRELAISFGISEKLVSLTIVAFSTSLPELITSITATKKGEEDMAIGNIIGSQILNILLIIGVSSVISPITYSISYNMDLYILIAASILFVLYPFIGKKDTMTRYNGILFVCIYILYMINLVIKNIWINVKANTFV